jgi:hypothetical protein
LFVPLVYHHATGPAWIALRRFIPVYQEIEPAAA